MTLPLTLRGTLVSVIIILGLTLLLMFGVARCSQDEARKARNETTVAEGRTTSAVEAIEDIADLNARGDISDAQLEQAHDAIRQANPADRDAIARYELCRLQQRADCDGVQ